MIIMWEFFFLRFLKNYWISKISADYWSCIPRSCSRICSKFRTVKKYVVAKFFSQPVQNQRGGSKSRFRFTQFHPEDVASFLNQQLFWKIFRTDMIEWFLNLSNQRSKLKSSKRKSVMPNLNNCNQFQPATMNWKVENKQATISCKLQLNPISCNQFRWAIS